MSEPEDQKQHPQDIPIAYDGVTGEPLYPTPAEPSSGASTISEPPKRRPGRPRKVASPAPPGEVETVAETPYPPIFEDPIQLPPPDNSDAWRHDVPQRASFEPVVHEPVSEERPFEPPFVPVSYTPEPAAETVRQSGLAWSMGIVFFGSVAFMLFLGWLADLLLGSSPWGIVVGVVLGSIIGFIQFFRISAQIFSPKKTETPSLLSDDDRRP